MSTENLIENLLPEENFADILEESLAGSKSFDGKVVKGKVLKIEKDVVIMDVGLKSEGRIPLQEFKSAHCEVRPGDEIEIYVERMENRDGESVLSFERARREAAWSELEKSHLAGERVLGVICNRVKGGFTVDLAGAIAFLPGSQVDFRPIKDPTSIMGIEQPFQILKMDRVRGNIVVSRRAILEESRAESRSELMSHLSEGQIIKGVVKNITDYGAFVDLGGIDGLLHLTDISWKRLSHPTEALELGQTIEAKIIKFDPASQRISLGIKQLEQDPWKEVAAKYIPGTIMEGTITNITDYGVFVELEAGIEGLIHISELSWSKKNVNPNKVVSMGEKIQVKILDIDPDKRRISLSIRQCTSNPWVEFGSSHKVGDVIEGAIKNIAEFGLFIGLGPEIDGMIHVSDLSWTQSGEEALTQYKQGDMIKAKLLDIDVEKERVALGVKQLTNDPVSAAVETVKVGEIVTCTVTDVLETGLEVKVASGAKGFIKKTDLSRERAEQKPARFAVDERVDALVTSIDQKTKRIQLSIKAREIKEEKEAMAEYGSSDSGASLGDILGAAINLEKMREQSVKNVQKKEKEEVAKKSTEEKKKAAPKKAATKASTDETSEKPVKAPKKKATPKKKEE